MIYADRVKETSSTIGVGTYALSGAMSGFRTFESGAGNNSTVTYCAEFGPYWEIGQGTVVGNTLTRTTILSSSNANAAVDWTSGIKTVYLTASGSRIITSDGTNQLSGNFITGNVGNAVHSFSSDTSNSVAGANVTGTVALATKAGTVTTNAQPNITSLGSLTSLTVGNVLTANGIVANSISVAGVVTSGTTGNITGVNVMSATTFIGSALNANSITANNITTGNVVTSGAGGNITGVNVMSATTFLGTVGTAAQPNITSVGTLTSLAVSGNISGTLTTAAQPNITSVGTLSSLAVTGNVSANNITGTLTTAAQPNITSLGTITSLVVGSMATSGLSGNITGVDVLNANTANVTSVNATGNVVALNFGTSGTNGNISGVNVFSGSSFTGTTFTASGNVSGGNIVTTSNIIVPKTSGLGILVDTSTPTYPWMDLFGVLRPDTGGANAPTLSASRGGLCREYFYTAADKMDMDFHIPHDYLPNSDMFIHLHWGHNGTAISGSFVVTFAFTYAKGHQQSIFPVEKQIVMTVSTPNIATIPQHQHNISEVAFTSAGGSASLLDRALLEVDGIVQMNMTVTTIPTITGGSVNEPYICYADLHYQSTGIGTKQKSPPFWT
jgi:hypothetical protein